MTLSVFSSICLTRYNSMQYSTYLPGLYLLIPIQLRSVLFAEQRTNTLVNSNLNTNLYVFSGICLSRYNSMQYFTYLPGLYLLILIQLRSVLFSKGGTNYSHTIIKRSIISYWRLFWVLVTYWVNERNYKFCVVIYKRIYYLS